MRSGASRVVAGVRLGKLRRFARVMGRRAWKRQRLRDLRPIAKHCAHFCLIRHFGSVALISGPGAHVRISRLGVLLSHFHY